MSIRFAARAIALSVFVAACGAPPEPAAPQPAPAPAPPTASVAMSAVLPPPPVRTRVAADTARTTAAGTTFTVPAGWTIVETEGLLTLEAPEPDTHLAIVEVTTKSVDDAFAAAWRAYRPDAKRPLKLATPRPGRRGWDEMRVNSYETSPNEKAVVEAVAHRAGDAWTVLIIDGSEATIERREAGVVLVAESLRAKGRERESFAGKKPHALDAAKIAVLRDFLAAGQKMLGVPGVGLALIDGGKVVFEGGSGVRELGSKKAVDEGTRFAIASNTKGMATLLLAKLVDEGKLGWETPVTQVYPDFRLGDAATTAQVKVKHLVCACTGLPRQDFEWILEYSKATPDSSMKLLGTLQPTTQFGETFQYSNLLAGAAGYVAGHLVHPKRELGAAFDDAMREKVFAPLGMKGATFDLAKVVRENHASPHAWDVAASTVVTKMDLNHSVTALRPAGGAWMSAHDLAQYALLELAKGKLPDGKRYVSEEALLARRAMQVKIGEDSSYGMGLEVDTGFGVPMVHHGGSLFGYKSDWMILPEHGVGAVLLTNSDTGRLLLRPFFRRMVEVLFDGKLEAEADLAARTKALQDEYAKARERLVIPADAAEGGKLAARYTNPVLGEIAVKRKATELSFDFGEFSSVMGSRKNDDGTMSFWTLSPEILGLDFVVGERNGKRVLVFRDAQHEYVFTEG